MRQARAQIRSLEAELRNGRPARVLDVGGRKSHYTIGVDAHLLISDIPRSNAVQKQLNLGFNNSIIQDVRTRRGNVSHVVFDNMTASSFQSGSFDCVVAIEVLEHVELDDAFVKEVARVLRPGGVFYMTTPNGDFVKNTNPDHRRHYRRAELAQLLERYFPNVEVRYAVRSGPFHRWGLKTFSPRRPFVTLRGMVSNIINAWESDPSRVSEMAQGTQHLVALARKTPAPQPAAH
jgi:SAM-dependent methyltransferase